MHPRNSLLYAIALSLAIAAAAAFFAPKASAVPAGFVEETISTGWNLPVGFTFDDNGRKYVWEKGGKVWIVENGTKLPNPLIDISEEVGNWRDFGMLGFALDPNFLENGHIYLYYVVDRHHLLNHGTSSYNSDTDEYFKATIGRITRYTANSADGFRSVNPTSRLVILGETKSTGVPILHQSHGTGALIFGADGSLIAASGDGASYSSVDKGSASETYYQQALTDGIIRSEENVGSFRSQMLGSLNGKIVRIDPATGDGIPGNPYFDPASPRSPKSRVWALGLRNPFRITLKPGTGNPDPAIGNPGTFYIGDVGWGAREEVNIADAPGLNFGWPIYQGHDSTEDSRYANARTDNQDVQNPLWGTPGCDDQFLDFQDLIAQAQSDHNPSFPNPCDTAVPLPASIPKWMHTRPSLDYARNKDSVRVGIFDSSGAHDTVEVGSPGAPTGDEFRGNCAVGGVWHDGVGFPETYGPSYYHADYGTGHIIRITYDSAEVPQSVELFHSIGRSIVFAGVDPNDNSIQVVDIYNQTIRRIRYAGSVNLPPVAQIQATKTFSSDDLTTTFDASPSSDPEGEDLSYSWDFGDGNTATGPDPSHTFSTGSNAPAAFTVTLTVADPGGESDTESLIVSVNNTPPAVQITGFENGDRYPMDAPTTIPLAASVSDAEHDQNSLAYEWQIYLHHANHYHPEPISVSQSLSALFTPTPASSEFYAYRVRLTVTDPLGLSTEVNSWLYPEQDPSLPAADITAPSNNTTFTDGLPITITAEPTGAADRVEFYANGIPVGSASSAPYSTTFTPDKDGPVSIVALSVSGYASVVSDPVHIYYGYPPDDNSGGGDGELPEPWASLDVGNPGEPGSATFENDTFTVKASGRDIWSRIDEFHFVYQPLSGDGEIVAEVSSLTNIHDWAKAGLMLRSSLADNTVYAAMLATPVRGATYQWRDTVGDTTSARRNPEASAPRWVKIRRVGNIVAGYHSTDGVNWVTTSFKTLPLPDTIYAGLCLTSHLDDTLATATFKNVSFSGFGGPGENAPPSIALTSPSNGDNFTNTATVTISADASDSDGSIAKVTFYSGGSPISEDTSAPYSLDTVFPVAGTYAISAVATDDFGATATSGTATITITEDQTGGGLPSGWAGGDIGSGQPGSASFSSGVYTVRGSGGDIWGSTDGFHFARQTLEGDGEIIARVLSVENTDTWAKAGVMIRDGTGTSDTYAAMLMTPAGRAAFQYRATAGANSKGRAQETFTFPHWVRLTRIGDTFTGYRSADGTSWTQVSSATVAMSDTVLVGLAVTAHDPSVTNTSLFDNVIVSGGTGGTNAPPSITLTSPQNGTSFTSTETVAITADASDTDGSIASVAFYSGSTLIGEDTTAPFESSAVFPVAGSYQISAIATDNLGATSPSPVATITVTTGTGSTPPAPWQGQSIGNVGIQGSASYDAGLFTLDGSGSDIWGTRDSFHFLHQTLEGDGEIIAKLSAFNASHQWAKAGVMIRSSLADNAPFGSMLVTPGTNGGAFVYRTATAAHTKMRRHPLATAPRWVRVMRSGDRISTYHSADGTTWIGVGYLDIPMGTTAHIGLAITSHDNSATATAAFESVIVTP